MNDIIWYNDLVNPTPTSGEIYNLYNESSDALYSCETFEVVEPLNEAPMLLFGAFAGHSIEFKVFQKKKIPCLVRMQFFLKTETITPGNSMALSCDGWYTLLCKRVKEEQSVGQDVPFTLLAALREGYFNDGIIKSSEGQQVRTVRPKALL